MANHMREVAKILGVEIGEEFEVRYNPIIYGPNYRIEAVINNDGLKIIDAPTICGLKVQQPGTVLNELLLGNCKIKRKPFKPEKNDHYHIVLPGGDTTQQLWRNDYIDQTFYKLGNCYRTKEEAMVDVDKWVAFYNSDEPIDI